MTRGGLVYLVDDEDVVRDSAERASEVLRTSVVVPAEIRELTAHPGRHHRPVHAELLTGHRARHLRAPAADPE